MDESFFIRLDDVELRLRRLQRDLQELRAEAVAARPTAPPPHREPAPAAAPVVEAPRSWPEATDFRLPTFDFGRRLAEVDLLGARALAWAGGIVTVLGVVFFFVLAVNRGWIGPGLRVGLGAGASLLVFAAGFWLRRRYAETFAALAAVGAGIAGGYATLAAATVLYDLVPEVGALAAAAAIAGAGLFVALAWDAELVGALGLVGAIAAPALLALQGGLSDAGTAFAVVVFAAAAAVGVERRWERLLHVAAIVAAAQVVALALDVRAPHVGIVAVAAAFWALLLAVAPALQLRHGDERVGGVVATYAVVSAGVSLLLTALLFAGRDRGFALLVPAFVDVAVAVALRRRRRELAVLCGALALAVVAVATADIVSGPTLTYTLAAEGALLAFLALRLREVRFQLGALAYLALAAGHALLFEARPVALFVAHRHPATGAPALLAFAVAAGAYAHAARTWDDSPAEEGVLRPVAQAAAWVRERQRHVNLGVVVAAAIATVYAASLGILELFEAVWPGGGVQSAFERGHVAVTAVWGIAGVAALWVGSTRSRELLLGATAWIALIVVKIASYEGHFVAPTHRSWSFVAAGAAVFVATLIVGLRAPRNDDAAIVVSIAPLVALALLLLAGTQLASGSWRGVDAQGVAVLAVALLYVLAGAAVLRVQRDLATLLGGLGLAVGAAAGAMLLHGTWLVLAWSATAAALAALARAHGETRLRVASGVYAVIGAGAALVLEAPPTDLVVARVHPAHGVPALVLVVAAAVVFALLATEDDRDVRARVVAWWTAGVLAVYAASLAIIDVVERVSGASLHTEFQRGHTAVSALWGTLGLVLLYVGLVRRRPPLRVAGFVLFAISLGKLFLYDLPTLSSITRALSFLAVGAVLLLGGFFYQRLAADRTDATA